MKSTCFSHIFLLLFATSFAQPLSGTYSVGIGGDFSSPAAAVIDAMANGISGPVTFSILPGIYSEQFTVGAITGSSNTNRITIESQSGIRSDVKLVFEPTAINNYVIKFDGASFITIKDITIEANGSKAGRLIELVNASDHITFKGVTFYGIETTIGTEDYSLVYSDQNVQGTPFNSQFLNISGCEFYYGSYGVFYHANGTAGIRADSLSISGNSFTNQLSTGVYIRNIKNAEVSENNITVDAISLTSWIGIQVSGSQSSFIVNKNSIVTHQINSGDLRGIVLDNQSTLITSGYSCTNNMISLSSAGTIYGIEAFNSKFLSLYHNSILIHSNSGIPLGGSTCLYVRSTNSDLSVANNIFANRFSSTAFRYNSGTSISSAASFIDNNCYFTNGTNLIELTQSSEVFQDINTWNNTYGFDSHSFSFDPEWVSDSDLHLSGHAIGNIQYSGLPALVPNDFDGFLRSETAPYIGADESIVPLSGIFTGIIPVGVGGYPSINDALNALTERGYQGEISLELSNGTYNGQILLNSAIGTDIDNPLIITSASENASDVTLTFSPTIENNFVIKFDAASYITIKNITIEAIGSEAGRLIELANASDHITFRGVIFNGIETMLASDLYSLVYSDQNVHETTLNSQFLNISECVFNNGSYGIFYNANGTGGIRADSLTISNNFFSNQFSTAIYLRFVKNATVSGNNITVISQPTSSWTGIQVSGSLSSFYVSGNSIVAEQINSGDLRGIILDNQSTIVTSGYFCVNNMISLSGGGTVYGIEAFNTKGIQTIHNSILLHSSSATPGSSSAGFYLRAGITGQVILNNLVINMSGSYAFRFNSSQNSPENGISHCDYNNWYSNGSNIISISNDQDYSNLNMWKSMYDFDDHSISSVPSFSSYSDLHLSGNSIGDDLLTGTPTSILTDIDGESRDIHFPYMGADEDQSVSLPVELSEFNGYFKNGTVYLHWSTLTEQNNFGFYIEYLAHGPEGSFDSDHWNTLGFISGNGTTTDIHNYQFQSKLTILSNEVYFRLRQVDTDGAIRYSESFSLKTGQDTFQLLGNYPNPFNPSSSILFTIPIQSVVSFTVYDLTGRSVYFHSNIFPAGINKLVFEGTGLSTGIYYYTLEWADSIKQGKMTLIK